jgi:DNA transformation protein and related proteins
MSALVDHCLELLAPLGTVRARRMFGGHGLYLDDLFFALVAWERLYLKVDDETRGHFEAARCEPFVYAGKNKPIAMSYWTVPADAMESPASMQPWARLAIAAALRARAAKPAAARKAGATPPRTGATTARTAARRKS